MRLPWATRVTGAGGSGGALVTCGTGVSLKSQWPNARASSKGIMNRSHPKPGWRILRRTPRTDSCGDPVIFQAGLISKASLPFGPADGSNETNWASCARASDKAAISSSNSVAVNENRVSLAPLPAVLKYTWSFALEIAILKGPVLVHRDDQPAAGRRTGGMEELAGRQLLPAWMHSPN